MTSKIDRDRGAEKWVRCDTLADRWDWSPFDVVELLKTGLFRFRREFGDGAPPIGELMDAEVHIVDLRRWEADNGDRIHNGPVLAKDGPRLREDNARLVFELAALKAENAKLRSEIDTLRGASDGFPAIVEGGRDKNTRERWKENLRTSLALAVHVIGKGKKFTTEELYHLCRSLERERLNEEAMKILREELPKEYIRTGGRPVTKK